MFSIRVQLSFTKFEFLITKNIDVFVFEKFKWIVGLELIDNFLRILIFSFFYY